MYNILLVNIKISTQLNNDASINKNYINAVIILNPASGPGDAKAKLEKVKDIKKYANELGWTGELTETTLKKTATAIAEKAISEGKKHIVVCGGDGTVMEVLGVAANKDSVVGVVPLGTGNLFAQNLHISSDIKEAMHTALKGKILQIDLGKANGTFFSIMTGIGLDAEMLR